MAPRLIARQLAHPNGVLGRLICRLMNLRNAAMNEFAVQRLGVIASDRVLEIGFGGGVTLPLLLGRAAFVAGADRSSEVVRRANARYHNAVAAGRATFQEGVVEALPFGDGEFEKALTVNTVYFWRSLEAGFGEIHRVLKPGGRVVVGFLPGERMQRMNMPPDLFTLRAPVEVIGAMQSAGFRDVQVERPEPSTPWIAATGVR